MVPTGLLLATLLAPRPAAAQIEPPSSVHVAVSSAEVTGLTCRRRPFAWEYTRSMTGSLGTASAGIRHPTDPSSLVESIGATLLVTPMVAVAAPLDLIAAPFRHVCHFTLSLQGKLDQWAGATVPHARLEAEAASLIAPEVAGVRPQRVAVTRSSTTSDASGRFSLSLAAQTGRSSGVPISWRIQGQPGGQMQLEEKGAVFVLSETDPGFGVGAEEMEPITIVPSR